MRKWGNGSGGSDGKVSGSSWKKSSSVKKKKERIKIQLADAYKNFMKIIKVHSFWIKCYLRSIPKLRLRCTAVSRQEETVLYILSILSSLWCDRIVHIHSLGSVLCYHHWQYQQQSFVLVLGRVACKTIKRNNRNFQRLQGDIFNSDLAHCIIRCMQ